jgi:hypothetical protein
MFRLLYIGCDSTSAFIGKGKAKPWKILEDHPEFEESFFKLGKSFPVSEDLVTSVNKFVCLLYGNTISTNVDDCRYRHFISGKYAGDALPPNSDCLKKHIEKANLQAASWSLTLTHQQNLPSAVDNGWKLIDGQLEIDWMTRAPAPDMLLNCIHCKCKTGCKTMRCSCIKAGLKCSEACGCVSCENDQQEDEEELNFDRLPTSSSSFVDECESDDDFD